MQEDLILRFHQACSAMHGEPSGVAAANAWLTSLQENPTCERLCMHILAGSRHVFDRNGQDTLVIFTAAKLLHISLQRRAALGILHGTATQDVFWDNADGSNAVQEMTEVVLAVLLSSHDHSAFAVQHQLCRCLSAVITIEFCNTASQSQSPLAQAASTSSGGGGDGTSNVALSTTLSALANASQASPFTLRCLIHVLEELPAECFKANASSIAVRLCVKACRKLVTRVVTQFVEHALQGNMDRMDYLAGALHCMLIWTKVQYHSESAASAVDKKAISSKFGAVMASASAAAGGGTRSWICLQDLLETQYSGKCTLRGMVCILEQLHTGLSENSLSADACDVFACLLEVICELLTEPVSTLPEPPASDVAACASYEQASSSALGVLYMFASLCQLWETVLGRSMEDWCNAVVGRGEAALQESRERSRSICVEQNRRLVEGLVEATVLISERHGALLVSAAPFFAAARLKAGSEVGKFVAAADTAQNMFRLFGCLMAALALNHLPAAALVMEILHRPPLVQDTVSSSMDERGASGRVDIARLWLPHLMIIIQQQVTCRGFCTDLSNIRENKNSNLFGEYAQLQQQLLAFELGTKYRDAKLLDTVADDDDEMLQWLQFRCDSFQLLQGVASAWPGGSNLFELVHETVLSWLQQLASDLTNAAALCSTADAAEASYSVIRTARTTEALLFIWHALLESSFTSNRYDSSTSEANQANVLRSCTANENQVYKAVQVLKMTILVVSHVQHIPAACGFSALSLRYRCVKIVSLLPDVIGYHLPQELFVIPLTSELNTTVHEPTSEEWGENAFNIQRAHGILELVCNTYEETETGREACVDAFLTMSSGHGLKPYLQPHAGSLCGWLESTLERAHADAAAQLDLSQSSSSSSSRASLGNPGIALAAPSRHCHFAEKMSLVLGRTVTWLVQPDDIEHVTARVISNLAQALHNWISILQRPANSGIDNETLRRGTGMCRYFLGCLEGLVRGLGEGSVATQRSNANSNDSYGGKNYDSEDIERKSASGSDSAETPVTALAHALPQLAQGLMVMLEALYTLLWRDTLLLSDALLVNIADLAEHVARTACKLLEMPCSESASACEDVANMLLTHSDHILTQIHSLDVSSITFRSCFHAMGGLIELVISGVRWTSPEHGEVVLQVLSRALGSSAHMRDIEVHVCVCRQIQSAGIEAGEDTGAGAQVDLTTAAASSASAYPNAPDGFSSEMLCLSALLKLVRQACVSWPGFFSPSASQQQVCEYEPTIINKATNQRMLLSTLDVMTVAVRVSAYHFDAAMMRTLTSAWTALLDIPRSTRESRNKDKETRARSTTLSDDDILLSSCLRVKLVLLMSTLLMEGALLPSPRLMRPFTTLVSTFFASFPSSQQHEQAASQLSESACQSMIVELQRRGHWPNQVMATRVHAIHAAITASVSVRGAGTGVSQAASLKTVLCTIAAGKY